MNYANSIKQTKIRIDCLAPYRSDFAVAVVISVIIRCRGVDLFFLFFLFLFVFLLRRLFDQSHKSRIASYWGRGARCNYRTDGRLSCLALDYGGGPLVLGTETALTTTTWARPATATTIQESEGKQSGRGV